MNLRRPTVIDQAQWVLGIAVTALGTAVWGSRGGLATAVGAALAIGNLWAIRRLGARAVLRAASNGSVSQVGALVTALVLKMTAVFVLVWLAVRVFHLPVVPFALGISVLVVAILVAGPALAAESSADAGQATDIEGGANLGAVTRDGAAPVGGGSPAPRNQGRDGR